MKISLLLTLFFLTLVATGYCQNDRPQSTLGPTSPSQVPANDSGWHVTWVPAYLWLTGLNGNLGVAGRTIPVDVSFSDVFNQLNFGYMTALDVRKRGLGVLADFMYTDLSSNEASTPFGVLYSTANTDSQMYILDPEIYGRLFEGQKGFVDATAGARYWHLKNTLNLRPGLLPAFSASDSRDWVDPVLGGRFRLNLKKSCFVMLKGDGGGFGAGSQSTWQIYTAFGKEIKQKYSLSLGYRHLSVDYRDGGFVYDTNMNGMLLGFAIKFR